MLENLKQFLQKHFQTHPWAAVYCVWAVLATGLGIAMSGLSGESITRMGVIAFLILQFFSRPFWCKAFPRLAPRTRFILLGMLLASVVEGFHMISTPVFPALKFGPETSLLQGLSKYALDLAFTLPAYLLIFSVIWFFVSRYSYSFWSYVLIMGLAQTIGDGGLFYFLSAPFMLVFLPYPMSNYHAINILPMLAVREQLPPGRPGGARRLLAIPAVIATYLVCGGLIQIIGKKFGL